MENKYQEALEQYCMVLESLKEAITDYILSVSQPQTKVVHQYIQHAIIYRYETAVKLAVKVMWEYCQKKKNVDFGFLEKEVIRTAHELGIISDAAVWMDMLRHDTLFGNNRIGEAEGILFSQICTRYLYELQCFEIAMHAV